MYKLASLWAGLIFALVMVTHSIGKDSSELSRAQRVDQVLGLSSEVESSRDPSAETRGADNGQPSTSTVVSSSVGLSAMAFFSAITPENEALRTGFPEQLSISEPLNLPQLELERRIEGVWKVVFACDGKPVPVSTYREQGISTELNWRFNDGFMQLSRLGSNSIHNDSPKFLGTVESSNQFPNARYSIARVNNTTTSYVATASGYSDMEFQLRRVEETGEELIEMIDQTGASLICSDGSSANYFLVPIPVL